MDPDRFQEIMDLFDRAVELKGPKREAFLDSLGEEDRKEVLSMLRADEHASSFIETPAWDRTLCEEPADTASSPTMGTLGPYRLIREIGVGGMGSVYLAERADEQFQKQVAIKRIRSGTVSDELVERFRRERQTLANLDHENIARLLDGGVSADGSPFLVMEYIEGRPIDKHCRDQGLDLGQRLKLFRQVCEAVEYAHRSLVIHRDLKPGNILVTEEGQPKLLDFGIAKVLDPEREEDLTVEGARIMTPAYASPEQLEGGVITTASDVFSLGVILYELFTESKPYASDSSKTPWSIETDRRRDPERASTVVAKAGDAYAQKKARTLRGDLDNIVAKAIRLDPSRRYASVAQLLEDIDRYFQGYPVHARPDSVAYRASRFVRRNRIALATSVVVFLSLVGGVIGVFIQSRIANQERDSAATVLEFLSGMLASASPETIGAQGSIIDLLDWATGQMEEAFEGKPREHADVSIVLGQTYHSLGAYAKAEVLFRNSFDLRTEVFGSDHVKTHLARCELGASLMEQSRFDESELHLRTALAGLIEELGEDDVDAWTAELRLGWWTFKSGDLEGALELGQRLTEPTRPIPQADITSAMSLLVATLESLGHHEEAAKWAEEIYRHRARVDGEKHLRTLRALHVLASAKTNLGRSTEAVAIYERVLEEREKTLGPEHPETLSTVHQLAIVLQAMGQTELAVPHFRRVIHDFEVNLGERHQETLFAKSNLGSLLVITNREREAEDLLRKTMELQSEVLGEDHPQTLGTGSAFSLALLKQEKYPQARDLIQDLEQRCARSLPPQHVVRLAVQSRWARYLQGVKRYDEAERALRQLIAARKKIQGEDHLKVVETTLELAHVLREAKKNDEAEEAYRDCADRMEELLGPEHPSTVVSYSNLGGFYFDLDRYEEAAEVFEEAVELAEAAVQGSDLHGRMVLSRGICLLRLGEFEDAETHLLESHAILSEAVGDQHDFTLVARARLAELYIQLGRPQDAQDWR